MVKKTGRLGVRQWFSLSNLVSYTHKWLVTTLPQNGRKVMKIENSKLKIG